MSKTTKKTAIDPEQMELIENARSRIKQKKRLYSHFVVFLVGSIGIIILSQVADIGIEGAIWGIPWYVWPIFVWFLFLLYHAINVFLVQKLMGREWERKQYEKLVDKQKLRIEKMRQDVEKKHPAGTDNNDDISL